MKVDTRRVRPRGAARVCDAIFLPTACGHAAQANSSARIVSPGSLNPWMSLLGRSILIRSIFVGLAWVVAGLSAPELATPELVSDPRVAPMTRSAPPAYPPNEPACH